MEVASRVAFELEMWRAEALETGAIKTTEHWTEAAFEAGYKAAIAVAAEPRSDDAVPVAYFRGERGNYQEVENWKEGAFPVYRVAPSEDADRLREVLHRIGDMAHDASTGPAVPDVLWEIRRMAYDEA